MKTYQGSSAIASGVGVLILALAFVGCGDGAQRSASPQPTVEAATTAPALPATGVLHLVVCYDASASYPAQLRRKSTEAVGELLDALVVPGFRGAHIHERWITHKTRSAEADLVDWKMEPVPNSPVRAEASTAPISPDPSDPQYLYDKEAYQRAYDDYENRRREWQLQVDANEAEFDQTNRRVDAAVAAAHEAARVRNDHVRSVSPPLADASDIGGCFQKASDVLSRAEGRRVLIVASDMAIYGTQDFAAVALSGVEIHVIYFYCEQATECDQRRQEWGAILGAVSVAYYDPDEDISTILKEEN
jgi:hypothetical protein